jgi:hypothetical protein
MKTVTKKGHGLGWKKQPLDSRDFRYEKRIRVAPEKLPASVDLSNLVSTVKDQGQLGSCVAHGTTSGFEAVQMKAAGKSTLGCRLLVYRDGRIIGGDFPGDNGCNIRDGIQATVQDGVAPETDWGYDISQFDNTPPAKAVSDAVKSETTKYLLLDSTNGSAQTLTNIKTCLATTGLPVVYGFPVYEQYEEVGSDGVIDMPSGGSIGGHCNMFFGYNDAKNSLMTLNSWGQGWGMPFGKFSGGAGWMPYGYVTQGLATDNWVIANESQITPTPTPTPTGVTFASSPTSCSVDGSSMEVFVTGSDKACWQGHRSSAGKWSWTSHGGVCTSAPAAIARGNLCDVFVRGNDNAIYTLHWDGKLWSTWKSLGGQVLVNTAPTVCSRSATTLDVFVIGADDALYQKTLTGTTWGAWVEEATKIK